MKTTPPLLLYLLVCCQTTESLTLKPVILGGNVTLDCELDNKEIYWFFLKPPESLGMILRTFSSETTSARFFDQRFKSKYSLKISSCLFISYITEGELGIYYCAQANTTGLLVSNGTKLYTTAANQNVTEENVRPQQMEHNTTTTHLALTLTSISLNVLLFITIIVLLMPRCRKPWHSPKPQQKVEAQPLEDLNTAEYSEIELPTNSRGAQPGQINGIYTLLEKPKPDADTQKHECGWFSSVTLTRQTQQN